MHDRRTRCRAHACTLLLWLCAATVAHADSVYRCRNARGEIAYQDRACGAGEQQSDVALDPPPPASAATHERVQAVRRVRDQQRECRRPAGRPFAHRLDQRGGRSGLVGDDENPCRFRHVGHAP